MNKENTPAKAPGLRERQRAARRQGILFAAGDLFEINGFEATSLEDVAVKAELSIPTIYSFFKSKQDLLLGLIEEDRYLSVPKLEALLEELSDDPVAVFVEFGRIMFMHGYDFRHKKVWREIMAASFRVSEDQNRYREMQQVNGQYIRAAIDKLCDKGSLRADLNRDSALRLLQNNLSRVFQLYILNEEMSVEEMMAMLQQDLSTLMSGMRKYAGDKADWL
ncbi:TetR/AcrR family transcriptional regulator [Erwiniaceae bacterium BAC15a-03b]|uniref:TetR/AcrR family transcriptional regulator n=1 Tax=Winslowiella arboricola TaxID=2978220 RepID=A0A9J6PVI5_9GAMM|nr:TetR/AcrR family transcriptional regulator [Winslowiella arboricola]MCU5775449.1 TetR/AcrR family transcriptional regulator [Winslowiella arboricola]MCU5779701.1 TetR/AcrR family transcriptional regulator [Winslowiella arboricola]